MMTQYISAILLLPGYSPYCELMKYKKFDFKNYNYAADIRS